MMINIFIIFILVDDCCLFGVDVFFFSEDEREVLLIVKFFFI